MRAPTKVQNATHAPINARPPCLVTYSTSKLMRRCLMSNKEMLRWVSPPLESQATTTWQRTTCPFVQRPASVLTKSEVRSVPLPAHSPSCRSKGNAKCRVLTLPLASAAIGLLPSRDRIVIGLTSLGRAICTFSPHPNSW